MIIRKIKKGDEKRLASFLLKLSDNTLFNWNRFGTKITKALAIKIAKDQVKKSSKEEDGFVAIDNNEDILGYGFLRYFPDKKQKIFNTSLGIAIADDYQGQGIGKKLMEKLITSSIAKKIKKVWLAVYSDNIKAVKFYKDFGFEVEGVFMYDEYFNNIPRHVISMAKFLDNRISNVGNLREKIIKDLIKG